MSKKYEEELRALAEALKLAEWAAGPYPTPENWNEDRKKNTKIVMAGYRALATLRSVVRSM